GTFTSGSTDNDTQLSFTTANWNAPQTVTVWGLDDNDTDGTQGYTVTLAVNTASTLDADYDKLSSRMLSLSNTDDETAGFLVSVPSGSTSESGDNTTFTVRLSSAPITGLQVMLDLSSSDTNEGRITAASAGSPSINSTGTSTLTFTSSTWNTPVTVTVSGQNDALADGDQRYRISLGVNSASTTASEYRLLDPPDVALVNTDDDAAGLSVSAPSTAQLSESGGNTTFTVKLHTAPTQNVTVPIYTSDPTEAKLNLGNGVVTSDNLTFGSGTTGPKTITVFVQDDNDSDGDQPVRVILSETSSSDANYHGLNPQDVVLTVTDDESGTPGFVVSAPDNATTTESGTNRTFTVKLAAKPTADLVIPLYVSDSSEALIASGGSAIDNLTLTFTSSNWSTAQTITVTAQDDNMVDGDVGYTVFLMPAQSADSRYQGLNAQDLSFVNADNDTVTGYGFLITNPTNSAKVQESDTSTKSTFTVALTSAPAANVDINLYSSDSTEATVSPTSLQFTSSSWGAKTVTVTALNDSDNDSDQFFQVILLPATSSDGNYNGKDPQDLGFVNQDDD
ncbi:MAG: Calx-beta domain-containing protein, partial [SAR324 cluster bacterium]|nr:Calx-beta domain-containing protein [SAR324 cluster bacterium]